MPDGITPLKQVTLREIHCSKFLHKELGELRGIANPRKRSDSFPVSSPAAGNEEHSDSEEKSTKEEIAALYASRAAEKLALL